MIGPRCDIVKIMIIVIFKLAFPQIMYEEICGALGIGINLHLQKNYLVRDIFSLGAPLLEAEVRWW